MSVTFRREILRVLNRGESVNALKRSIYVGRVAAYQAKQPEEMQAVADARRLLRFEGTSRRRGAPTAGHTRTATFCSMAVATGA
jgi:hypothetical protein